MRDHVDLFVRDAVDLLEERFASLSHHNEPIGERIELLHHPPLVQIRIL
jgi:hypothetical protein